MEEWKFFKKEDNYSVYIEESESLYKRHQVYYWLDENDLIEEENPLFGKVIQAMLYIKYEKKLISKRIMVGADLHQGEIKYFKDVFSSKGYPYHEFNDYEGILFKKLFHNYLRSIANEANATLMKAESVHKTKSIMRLFDKKYNNENTFYYYWDIDSIESVIKDDKKLSIDIYTMYKNELNKIKIDIRKYLEECILKDSVDLEDYLKKMVHVFFPVINKENLLPVIEEDLKEIWNTERTCYYWIDKDSLRIDTKYQSSGTLIADIYVMYEDNIKKADIPLTVTCKDGTRSYSNIIELSKDIRDKFNITEDLSNIKPAFKILVTDIAKEISGISLCKIKEDKKAMDDFV